MPYINIKVEFEGSRYDEEGEGFVYYTPKEARFVDSDLPWNVINDIGDAASQSDLYQVQVSNALLAALGGQRLAPIA